MVTVPGIVWRYGPILRGVLLGVSVGAVLGALSWLDSGFLLSGVIVFVVLSVFYGWWMARRMARHWPSATQLSGSERERVARAARCGEPIDDPRLGPALTDYRNGLHEAAEKARGGMFLRSAANVWTTSSPTRTLWISAAIHNTACASEGKSA